MAPDWAWQDFANCAGEDLVLFFGPDGERQLERVARELRAKAICSGCPVRNECLNYALDRPEKYGTWGGLNEDERQSERRRRMRRATPVVTANVATKTCVDCGESHPETEYYRENRASDGLTSACRHCLKRKREERTRKQEVA